MSALDEIISYCREKKPVGALLVTGEWGCGKTYLIEHMLKNALSEEACILRISLFGVLAVEYIQKEVKKEWFKAKLELNGYNKTANMLERTRELVSKLSFVPEEWREFIENDMTNIMGIENEIKYKEGEVDKSKKVILVFDDLERCGMNYVDVLGCINDYCENHSFHTIIVANQDKMRSKQNVEKYDLDISEKNADDAKKLLASKAVISVMKTVDCENEKITFDEIKEKIVRRTVHYIPDFTQIVRTVIQELPNYENGYNIFIKSCEAGLISLFETEDVLLHLHKVKPENGKGRKKPQNIRSLKCAIADFYRVFKILKENEIGELDKWLYSFAAYVISFKANIAKSGPYGTVFADGEVKKMYPAYRNEYMFESIKQWILCGYWDKELLEYEISCIKEKENAKTPKEILRSHYILDIEEDIIREAFSEVLTEAYTGTLTLDEYIIFICNSCYAREFEFEYPEQINWGKIYQGIEKAIDGLCDNCAEGRQVHKLIGIETRSKFSGQELSAYLKIEEFDNSDTLNYITNKKQYIYDVGVDPMTAFQRYQSSKLCSFDKEMAIATYKAYIDADNSMKSFFSSSFCNLLERNMQQYELNYDKTFEGLKELEQSLLEYQDTLVKQGKTIARRYTEEFIDSVQTILYVTIYPMCSDDVDEAK